MKRWPMISVLATSSVLCASWARGESISAAPASRAPPITSGESPVTASTPLDTVAAVRGVFAAKCSGCHGPNLLHPKGRFGYVLDLHRIAENPEMVVPSSPEESELWQLVKAGEMPPPDSPRGPLSEAQKNVIRQWIAEGANDDPKSAVGTIGSIQPATAEPKIAMLTRAKPKHAAESAVISDADDSLPPATPARPAGAKPPARFSLIPQLLWFGRFHLLAIHFPISLIVAAGLGELWSAWRRSRAHLQSVSFCIALAAIAAVPTVIFGWLHAAAGNGAASPELLTVHRWLGTTTGACAIAAAICCELDRRRGARSRLFQVLLALAVLLTIATAHMGAILVHGADFFNWN